MELTQSLIFSNFQALGDIVVLTAMVRDLHRQYPGKFKTRVSTPYQESVWLHNPNIAAIRDCPPPPKSLLVKCHYGTQFYASKHTRMHFLQAFHDYINKALGTRYGIELSLTDPKPDLHISDAEKAMYPMGKGTKYWVMMAGGKSDITTKWWDSVRYQEVVNKLQGKVKIVQAGARNHYHAALKGTHASLVGATTPRQFINLIYHSQGVIGPITAAMHIAAAFDKPAVVIAGGREMPWWEKYPGHTFLHMVGNIHCATPAACHMSLTTQIGGGKRCMDIVERGREGNQVTVARCMHAIQSDHVVDAVLVHDSGGPAKTYSFLEGDVPFVNVPFVASKDVRVKQVSALRTSPVSMPTTGSKDKPLGRFTLCSCLYGGLTGNETYVDKEKKTRFFYDLHKRLLDGMAATIPADRVQFRIAINGVGQPTVDALQEFAKTRDVVIYGPNENRLKYPRLREMFHDVVNPLGTEWLVCADDDVILTPDWLDKFEAGMRQNPSARCFGERYFIHLTESNMKWHRSRPWWRGVEVPTRGGSRRYRIHFITGGFFAVRSADMIELNWPDPALVHNGGDVALGSAMHQRGWQIHSTGVTADQHNTPRRGANHGQPRL